MTRYWVTTHWPHPEPDKLPWNVYLKSGMQWAVENMTIGDVVLFYESRSGKRQKGDPRGPSGREGIIAIGEVSGKIKHDPSHQRYTDGTEAVWASQMPCRKHDFDGYASRKSLNA